MIRTVRSAVLAALLVVCAASLPVRAAEAPAAPEEQGGSLSATYLTGKLYAQAALDAERLSRAYESELEQAGFYKLLNVQRLQGDPDMVKGKAILARSRDLAARYKARSLDLVKQGGDRIQALDTDEETRARLAASWERAQAEARAEVEEAWRLEGAIIERMAEVADLLARATGAWRVNGERLSFERGADSAEYTRRLAAAKAAMQAQDDFQSQARKKAFKRLLEIAK